MAQNRPLQGIAVGISISEAEDLSEFGFLPSDINTVTVEICRRIVALGGQVVLGHQWRPGGIMEQVTRFAQAYHLEAGSAGPPIIHNVMAYPDKAALSEGDREQLRELVRIYEPQEPEGRTEALTRMRESITAIAKARICLAGKEKGYSGSMPGLVEETLISIRRKQPVYLSAMMGGATAYLIKCIRGGGELRIPPEVEDYFRPNAGRRNTLALAELCRLHPDELDQLFDAQNLDTVVQLSTLGMSRMNGSLPFLT
jgi:SLOG cluster2